MEDEKILNEMQPYWSQLPHLKKIIVWGGGDTTTFDTQYSSNVLHWHDVMKLGTEDSDDEPVLQRQRNMAINQCCVLVYTSGTTGNPKGNIIAINCDFQVVIVYWDIKFYYNFKVVTFLAHHTNNLY